MARNSKKAENKTPEAKKPEVQNIEVKEAPKTEPKPEEAKTEKSEKNTRSNKDNKSNGTFELVRRNDNRIRLVSNGKTIATIQVGTKKCSIHTATNDVFDVLEEEVRKTVSEVKMGPNSYKLPVDTDKVDEMARKLFGTCEELIITVPEKK